MPTVDHVGISRRIEKEKEVVKAGYLRNLRSERRMHEKAMARVCELMTKEAEKVRNWRRFWTALPEKLQREVIQTSRRRVKGIDWRDYDQYWDPGLLP